MAVRLRVFFTSDYRYSTSTKLTVRRTNTYVHTYIQTPLASNTLMWGSLTGSPQLAECVALWGEPEQSVHGVKDRRAAASSGMKGKRVTIRLVVAFALTTYVTRVGGGCARGMYSHSSPVPQQLASFPGPKTGRGYSAVVLDRPRPALRRFSVPECWAGPVNEATVVSRDYLSSCTSSTPCFLF